MKKVVNCYYVHTSNVDELMPIIAQNNDIELLSWATSYMYYHQLRWEVLKYDVKKHTFSLISCPTFDVRYEPIVGDSYLFKEHSVAPKWISGGTTVYHQKHLFVNEVNYNGFDVKESWARTQLLESIPWIKENKSRMGSKRIWEEFLVSYGLKKYMP